jgi:hypothetical protein
MRLTTRPRMPWCLPSRCPRLPSVPRQKFAYKLLTAGRPERRVVSKMITFSPCLTWRYVDEAELLPVRQVA